MQIALNYLKMKDQGKAFQAIAYLQPKTAHILVTIVPSMYAVTNIGKPMCIAFQASSRNPNII